MADMNYTDTDSVLHFSIYDMYPSKLMNIKPLIRPWYIRALYTLGRRLCKLSLNLTIKWRRRRFIRYHRKCKRK